MPSVLIHIFIYSSFGMMFFQIKDSFEMKFF